MKKYKTPKISKVLDLISLSKSIADVTYANICNRGCNTHSPGIIKADCKAH